jgi:general secretion pathway protein G
MSGGKMTAKIKSTAGNNGGFSFLELMVVIVILGILAMYIAPKFMGRTDEARMKMARVQIEGLGTALDLYKLDNGFYPSTEQGLQALIEQPQSGQIPKNWRKGGYLKKGKVPRDPWQNEYAYQAPGVYGDYDIICYGADGVPGGEDENKDITSWDVE